MLRRASYDGFSFEVIKSNFNFGRRTVPHEYPQQNYSYVEDLGKITGKITIDGFIIGVDYLEKSKKLIELISHDRRSNEPKILVHPWLGELKVIPIETPNISWNTTKRIATFSLTFLEADEKDKISEGFSLSSAIYKIREQADTIFDKYVLNTRTFNLIRDHIDDVKSVANTVIQNIQESNFGQLAGLTGNIDLQLKQFWTSVETGAQSLAKNRLLQIAGIVTLSGEALAWTGLAVTAVAQTKSPSLKGNAAVIASTANTATTAQQAFKTSMRLTMFSNALGAVSFIPSTSNVDADGNQVINADEDLISLRNNLLNSLENEMIIQGTDNSDMYEDLSKAYSDTYQLFKGIIGQGSEAISLKESEPALVLAYDKYEDASRVDEISSRNRVVNPLFLPTENLLISKN